MFHHSQLLVWFGLSVCFSIYGLGMRSFRTGGLRWQQILLVAASYAATLTTFAAVWAYPPTWAGALVGVGLCAAGSWLFIRSRWTHRGTRPAFALGTPQPVSFQQHGPYLYIRHPIYSAYLLGWLVGPLATGQAYLLAVPLVMGVVFFLIARQEEIAFSTSAYAASYQQYRKRTGMFIPRWFKHSA